MNKAILIGRLTRDPELRYTSSNRAVCQFTVAIDRPFTNQASGQREADFINVVAWDKTGENVGKYMNEGRRVYVTEVIANNVQFLESRNAQNTNNNSINSMPEPPMEKTPYDFANDNEKNETEQTIDTENDPFASFGEQIEISDNDLPF